MRSQPSVAEPSSQPSTPPRAPKPTPTPEPPPISELPPQPEPTTSEPPVSEPSASEPLISEPPAAPAQPLGADASDTAVTPSPTDASADAGTNANSLGAIGANPPIDFFANFKRPGTHGSHPKAAASPFGQPLSMPRPFSTPPPTIPSSSHSSPTQMHSPSSSSSPEPPSAAASSSKGQPFGTARASSMAHAQSSANVQPANLQPANVQPNAPAMPSSPFPAQNLIPFPASGLRQSQKEQAEFVIPLSSDEYLPAMSRWTTWGGLVLLSAIGAATGLAAVTPSPVLVRTAAVVRPLGELKVVQAIAEGTIESIKVEEGESIEQGQAIAVLDDSRLQTRQRQLEVGLQQRQMQIQQLQAQIVTLETQRIAEQNLTERAIASARAELLRVERDHADRRAVAQKDVQESEALMAAALAEYESYKQAAEVGVLPRVQAETKQQSYNAAKARVERAQTALNPSTASITMAQENIAQTQAQGSSTQASLQRQRESLLQQQAQIRQQMQQDEQELIQVQQEFDKMVIRAQTDGELLKLNLRNEGQVVRSGEVIAQVFPKDAPLTIKAKIMPQDIGQVSVGQRVNMRVSAYSYADYGTLEGTVTAVGSDAISPQSQSGAAAPNAGSPSYFEVTIQPEQDFLLKGDQEFEISPGMEVQADIVAKDETVLTMVLRKARILTGL